MEIHDTGITEKGINVYKLYKILKKRRFIVFVCLALSLFIAIYLTLMTTAVYKVSNVILIESSATFLFDDISIILQDEDLLEKVKSQKSDLDKSILNKIVGVKIRAYDKKEGALRVDVISLEGKAGVDFLESLPHYVLTRPFILSKIENQKKLLQANIDDLYLLKSNPIKEFHVSGNMFFVESAIFSMFEKYNQYIHEFKMLKSLQFVTLGRDTIQPKAPNKTKKIMIILIGVFIGLFIGVFLALIIEGFVATLRSGECFKRE